MFYISIQISIGEMMTMSFLWFITRNMIFTVKLHLQECPVKPTTGQMQFH